MYTLIGFHVVPTGSLIRSWWFSQILSGSHSFSAVLNDFHRFSVVVRMNRKCNVLALCIVCVCEPKTFQTFFLCPSFLIRLFTRISPYTIMICGGVDVNWCPRMFQIAYDIVIVVLCILVHIRQVLCCQQSKVSGPVHGEPHPEAPPRSGCQLPEDRRGFPNPAP